MRWSGRPGEETGGRGQINNKKRLELVPEFWTPLDCYFIDSCLLGFGCLRSVWPQKHFDVKKQTNKKQQQQHGSGVRLPGPAYPTLPASRPTSSSVPTETLFAKILKKRLKISITRRFVAYRSCASHARRTPSTTTLQLNQFRV